MLEPSQTVGAVAVMCLHEGLRSLHLLFGRGVPAGCRDDHPASSGVTNRLTPSVFAEPEAIVTGWEAIAKVTTGMPGVRLFAIVNVHPQLEVVRDRLGQLL